MFKSKKTKHEISIFCFQNNSEFLEEPYGQQNKNESPSYHKRGGGGVIRRLILDTVQPTCTYLEEAGSYFI